MSEFDQVIASYLDGRHPDRKKLLAQYPKHRKRLLAFFRDDDRMEKMTLRLRDQACIRTGPWEPFGQYELLEWIGEGGMGRVYRARKKGEIRTVALKQIRSDPSPSAQEIRRFHVEAEAVMSLDHPQIVRLYEHGECDGRPYFTMQYLEGGTLDDNLAQFRTPKAAGRLIGDLARAIDHAHNRGILHRDLKSVNIIFDRDLHPYVADWGLAKRFTHDQNITRKGDVYGTPPYMAPELMMLGKVTTSVDIYSLGVILYELLAGRVPFLGRYPKETLDLKLKCDPRPLPVDRDLSAVCLRCLHPDPEHRYKTAKELADDLDRWLAGKTVRARPGAGAARLIRAVREYIKRFQDDAHRRELLQELVYTSSAVADRVLMKLKDWSVAVLEAANDPDLPDRLKAKDPNALQRFLDHVRDTFDEPARGFADPHEPSPFELWILFDDRGVMVATSPRETIVGRDFSRREWFHGAAQHRGKRGLDSVHVSKVFYSVLPKKKNLCKFALSVPVYGGAGPDAPLVGVLGASFTTDSNLGIPRLNDTQHKVIVAGRFDPDSYGRYSKDDYLVLAHPSFSRGDPAAKVDSPRLKSFASNPLSGELRPPEAGVIGAVDEEFEDPLGERDARYKGRRWAGIAPIGNTPLVAIVERRPDPGMEPSAEIAVGQLVDLTGPTAAVGEPYAKGVAAYASWLNAQGGIDGKTVGLFREDYANREDHALKFYSALKTDRRVVAIQGWGTGDSEALVAQAAKDRIPFFSASCSARLADPRKAPYNFFVAADYSTQIRGGLQYVSDAWRRKRAPRLAFVFPDHPYGTSPIPAGRAYAHELGFKIVGEEYVPLDGKEAAEAVSRLKALEPDVCWIGGTTRSATEILKKARRLGLRTRFLVNLWGNDEHLAESSAAEGVIGLQASVRFGDDVSGMAAIRTITEGENLKNTHYIRGWVSMMVLCEGLRRAAEKKNLTGPGIKQGLETLKNFDPEGLMPPVTFTPKDHRPTMDVKIYEFSRRTMHLRRTVAVERRRDWLGF